MTLLEMVAALERVTRERYADQFTGDAPALVELASLLKGAQEAWLHEDGTLGNLEIGGMEDLIRAASDNWRRVYIVPAEEEK